MAASLQIITSSYTAIPTTEIDTLLELARRHHIDAFEKPRAFGIERSTALELIADVTDHAALIVAMKALRHWSERLELFHATDLTVRMLSPCVMIELTSPAFGSKQMAAVCADIVESVRLLENASVLQYVTRIVITPARDYCDVRADVDGNPAYLVDTERGTIRKGPGAGNAPDIRGLT